MPITSSAKKALRQNVRRKKQNVARRDAYKKAVRDIKKLVASKKADEARAMLAKVYQALDKAAKTNSIPKGKADRLKGRVAQLIARSSKTSS
jgi:ribosomal protein S20